MLALAALIRPPLIRCSLLTDAQSILIMGYELPWSRLFEKDRADLKADMSTIMQVCS